MNKKAQQQHLGSPTQQDTSTSNSGEGGSQATTTSGGWQEYGLFLRPIQRHTGVYHDENGVFFPWTHISTYVLDQDLFSIVQF
jgi:hypothetical protein